jgi:hypothetical protein
VDSNDKKVNPNLTVLEWLNRRPGFEGRVSAYGSWDVLPYIVAAERSGLHVNGEGPAVLDPASDRERLLDEFTAEWAHERRYDLYLDAAHRSDRFVRRLWETAQSLPAYRGRTALVLATDHGRGASPRDWTDHGEKVPAAERIWMAMMGPGTPALGVREAEKATQSQLAATVAALLGEDFRAASPNAAPPLPDIEGP